VNVSGSPRRLLSSSFLVPAVSSHTQNPSTVIQQMASEMLQLQDSMRKLR